MLLYLSVRKRHSPLMTLEQMLTSCTVTGCVYSDDALDDGTPLQLTLSSRRFRLLLLYAVFTGFKDLSHKLVFMIISIGTGTSCIAFTAWSAVTIVGRWVVCILRLLQGFQGKYDGPDSFPFALPIVISQWWQQ